ncbi:hypothetical protein [Streptomyces mangrovisoli]|uniref:Protein kilB n=1 Tax=Streptomyces mangrovisoli TaxID=1428628 RepID=A0A1J4NSP2_9ACTN|nr:hypothetical protein [Streptomyces mangrovisoli]OIJ64253.1 hypothetical protein WN71_029230 [Streptomyces mangrovisoli]
MSWAVVVSTVGGVLTTLAGVAAGALLSRRAQERHWLKDAQAQAYAGVLRAYTRVEFDLRGAHLGKHPVTQVDWAPWGGALAALSLVADEEVVAAAGRLGEVLNALERVVHEGEAGRPRWTRLQTELAAAQMDFVNTARRGLDRRQPAVRTRIGGPLIEAPE